MRRTDATAASGGGGQFFGSRRTNCGINPFEMDTIFNRKIDAEFSCAVSFGIYRGFLVARAYEGRATRANVRRLLRRTVEKKRAFVSG